MCFSSFFSEASGQGHNLASRMMQTLEKSAIIARDEELRESVRQVLQAHTDGVALHQFAEVYQVRECWRAMIKRRDIKL